MVPETVASATDSTVRSKQFRLEGEGLALPGAIFNGGLDTHGGGIRCDLGRGDIGAPVSDAQLVRQPQPHMAVNARAGVPA